MTAASPHLDRLARTPRATGTDGADDGRRYCRAILEHAGFAITERAFEYSQFPGRWAAPLAGVAIAVAALGLHISQFHRAALGWTLAGVALALAYLAQLGSHGVLRSRRQRHTGVNLEAVRRAPPKVWLVAHIDSKWQPVSMIARVAGVIGSVIGLLALVIAVLFPPAGNPAHLGAALVLFTWMGAAPLIASVVGSSRNTGALDNASGVAAVLEAAQLLPPEANVGVLITDAEELALAGARAWSVARIPAMALNCDSVDDDGPLVVMYSRSAPERLVSQLRQAASAIGEPLRVLRLIPGVLTDHVPLAERGWQTLTLSRGTFRTLRRIHTSRDTLGHLTGRGIAGAARVLARTATELAR